MTDRLSLANALAEAKIDRPAAERIATEIFEAIHDSVATKADLQHTEDATKAELNAMRGELQATRAELKADVAALRAELKADIAELKAEMMLVEHRLLTRLGGLVVVVAGILFAVLRYLPPAR